MRTTLPLPLPLLLSSLLSAPLGAQVVPGALVLVGEGGASKTLTMAELAALPQVDVIVQEQDSTKVVFRGPTIRALMSLVGAPTGHALRGPSMLLAVLAEQRAAIGRPTCSPTSMNSSVPGLQ